MDIRVYFDVVHTFIDGSGNEYMTDVWQEEDIELEVDNLDNETIVNEIVEFTTENAKYLVIECKEYDYIDQDEETISGLRLATSHIKRIRYDDFSSSEAIEIDGEHIVRF